jgi:transposase
MARRREKDRKDEALRQHSALNPRPDGVHDELFTESGFFDAHDVVQVKYEMLRRVQQDGWSVAQAARTFGFSRNAFYQAQKAFRDQGIAGLFRERPGPRRAHKFSEEVMDFVEKALAKDESLSTRALRQLIHGQFGISVHRRSIERARKRREKKGGTRRTGNAASRIRRL